MSRHTKQSNIRQQLYQRAVVDAFRKLDPRTMVRNPVMFVVEVGSALTTALFVQALFGQGEASPGFRRGGIVVVVHSIVREFL
jgi:K+-transporting ATPase ATPase B chain